MLEGLTCRKHVKELSDYFHFVGEYEDACFTDSSSLDTNPDLTCSEYKEGRSVLSTNDVSASCWHVAAGMPIHVAVSFYSEAEVPRMVLIFYNSISISLIFFIFGDCPGEEVVRNSECRIWDSGCYCISM